MFVAPDLPQAPPRPTGLTFASPAGENVSPAPAPVAHTPTDEQIAIIDAARTCGSLVVEAGAGCAKSTTLKMVAADQPRRRMLYLCFNKAIQLDAERSFGPNVNCRTTHSIAFGPVGVRYRHRLGGPRVPAWQAAKILGIHRDVRLEATYSAGGDAAGPDRVTIRPMDLARLALETVNRFCYSADAEIGPWHVPHRPGLESFRDELVAAVLPYAVTAWYDIVSTDGRLRFEHDYYLKLFQLTGPVLPYDVLMVDEAQDLNPVTLAIVTQQRHAQILAVGDSAQQINAWRGATNALTQFGGQRLTLSQSWRFGPDVADEANKWLGLLDAALQLRGNPAIRSTVTAVEKPDAVLCRSNGGVLTAVLGQMEAGRKVALVRGGPELKSLANACRQLQDTGRTDHPELMAFDSWKSVQEFVDTETSGSDLKVFVKLVDKYGVNKIIRTVDATVPEDRADVVVSTAHTAKGREWGAVRIGGDFHAPREDKNQGLIMPAAEELRLSYVAVTRARTTLDRGSLAWIDEYA